jgi:hypothetical protein
VAIDWDRLTRPEYDQIVEALVARMYPAGSVRAVNGRGGDGGKDIVVREGARERVFR